MILRQIHNFTAVAGGGTHQHFCVGRVADKSHGAVAERKVRAAGVVASETADATACGVLTFDGIILRIGRAVRQ